MAKCYVLFVVVGPNLKMLSCPQFLSDFHEIWNITLSVEIVSYDIPICRAFQCSKKKFSKHKITPKYEKHASYITILAYTEHPSWLIGWDIWHLINCVICHKYIEPKLSFFVVIWPTNHISVLASYGVNWHKKVREKIIFHVIWHKGYEAKTLNPTFKPALW